MISRRTWNEFKKSGLLWFINTILHAFGWSIVLIMHGHKLIEVYPARVKFRGFNEETNTKNYLKLTEWLANNSNELLDDVKGDLYDEE